MKQDMQALVEQRFIENYPKYYRLAYRYLNREADAQDAVQEAAYKAILKCRTLRRNSRRTEDETALALLPTEDRYEDLDLRAAIARLDELDQTIINLRFFEELKLEQIAAVTEQPLSKVKSRLYRAIKKLRLTLTEEEAG